MKTDELYNAVKNEMNEADKKVRQMKADKKQLEGQIEYWERQAEAARTLSSRLAS